MATPEDVNKNNLENKEIPKVNPENLEQKEISEEELLTYLDSEENKFKTETSDEMSGANSINLDPTTFEQVKNETGVEKELNTINQEAENVISETKNELVNENTETISPELQQELNKLKFLQEEKIRLQKRYDELEKGYKENFQLVSKKELSWYESEMSSIHNKLDNMRYDIPKLEKIIEVLKNPVIESSEQAKNTEQNELMIEKPKVDNQETELDTNKDENPILQPLRFEDIQKFAEETGALNSYGSADIKEKKLVFLKEKIKGLNENDLSEIERLVKIYGDDTHGSFEKALDSVIGQHKNEQIDYVEEYLRGAEKDLAQNKRSELTLGQKLDLVQEKLQFLFDNQELHSEKSVKEISLALAETVQGKRELKDLNKYELTIGNESIPINLETTAYKLIFDSIDSIKNIYDLERIAGVEGFGEKNIPLLDKINSGEYVNPSDSYGRIGELIIGKANEIMGLKKSENKRNADSQWTDLNNPPAGWNPNSRS